VTRSEGLKVDDSLSIPRSELSFRASKSGGPGGQHVNTSSTRVEIVWNPSYSRALSTEQRERLESKLANRLDSDGNIRVVASSHRSQLRNREEAETRLAALVRSALTIPKSRRKTKPSRAVREARLESKRRSSVRKQQRRLRDFD
jgi:ribosome-associated protein